MRVAHTSDSAAQTERADEQCRQDHLRDGEWEGSGASEGALGGRTGVARRRTGGTRRARGSSGERDHGDSQKKKTEKADMTPRKDTQRGQGAGGGGNRGPARVQRSRGAPKKNNEIKFRQGTKDGQTEGVGPRGRRGMQGANKGAKVHIVSHRETPCR